MKPKRFLVLGGAAAAILAAQVAQPALATDNPACPYKHASNEQWFEIPVANFASHPQADQAARSDRNGDGSICFRSPPRDDRYRLKDNQL